MGLKMKQIWFYKLSTFQIIKSGNFNIMLKEKKNKYEQIKIATNNFQFSPTPSVANYILTIALRTIIINEWLLRPAVAGLLEPAIPHQTDDISHPRHFEWTPNMITFARDTLKAQIRITHFVVFVLLFHVISRCFIGVPCVCAIVAGEEYHITAIPLVRIIYIPL